MRTKLRVAIFQKLRVAVLMGGPSAEHEISLKTGEMVLKNLNPEKYEAQPIVIDKEGSWPLDPARFKNSFDVAFLAMHGEYGEDGTVQKILEKMKMPYTGSNSKASHLGMDKEQSLKIFQKKGLAVADFVTDLKKMNKVGLPMVIKPLDRGSSVGISIVHNFSEVVPAVKEARKYSNKVMAQKYIKGREFTCGVINMGKNTVPLLPTEIIPIERAFFDYHAKYTPGSSKEITPPRLSRKKVEELQNLALQAHKAIGARGLSRTDFILGQDGNFYVLEINTLPGMTETSLLPQAAQAVGISFPELLDIIIENAQ